MSAQSGAAACQHSCNRALGDAAAAGGSTAADQRVLVALTLAALWPPMGVKKRKKEGAGLKRLRRAPSSSSSSPCSAAPPFLPFLPFFLLCA
jgi:hypothetical protein